MPCFVIAQLNVTDRAKYRDYQRAFGDLFHGYDGRVLAADDAPAILEGDWPYERLAMIEFRDRDEAMRWYMSPEYQAAIRDHRWPASTGNVILAEGLLK